MTTVKHGLSKTEKLFLSKKYDELLTIEIKIVKANPLVQIGSFLLSSIFYAYWHGVKRNLHKKGHFPIPTLVCAVHRVSRSSFSINIENKKNYNGWRAYSNSKFLNVLFTYYLSMKLDGRIVCNCLSPGFIDSNFGNNNKSVFRIFIKVIKKILAKNTKKGAETILFMALDKSLSNINGKFFQNCKIKKTSKETYDKNLMKKVWDLSLNYINI